MKKNFIKPVIMIRSIYSNLALDFQGWMSTLFHCHSCLHFHNKLDHLLTPVLYKDGGQFHRKCLLPRKSSFYVHRRVAPIPGLYNHCRQRCNNVRRLDKMWVGTSHRNLLHYLDIHHPPNIFLLKAKMIINSTCKYK